MRKMVKVTVGSSDWRKAPQDLWGGRNGPKDGFARGMRVGPRERLSQQHEACPRPHFTDKKQAQSG